MKIKKKTALIYYRFAKSYYILFGVISLISIPIKPILSLAGVLISIFCFKYMSNKYTLLKKNNSESPYNT